MIRGLYTAASGALVAQTMANTIANNLANVDTAGFKRTLLQIQSAPSLDLYRFQTDPGHTPGRARAGVAVSQPVGALGTGAWVYDTPTVFTQGALQQTGNPLDVALSGSNAFFSVQTPHGVRYTRDGEFVRNQNGYLSTQNGDLVLGQNGPIALPIGGFQIAQDGTITQRGQVLTQTKQIVDQLQITQFGNLVALRPQGGNLFVNTGAARPAPATAAGVQQGFLEKSNAGVVKSMVDMITAERWFQANIKSISAEDAATKQALTDVAIAN
ncbi:MAG: flagellar hook-basal body protein [Bacillati bacterium]